MDKPKKVRTASQIGKANKLKGKRSERRLATELREAFPHLADQIKRGWQSRGGSEEADVKGIKGLHFESKSGKKVNHRKALAQAIEDSADGKKGIPVVVARDDGKEPVAMLRWSDLLTILQVYVKSLECSSSTQLSEPSL